ncbi:MAG TPA: excisionase family DNA-binding protein [Desulfosporosinus sp.]|nr:excisionase family DNA-binding protein [Desulfosporosinus sp.]
MTRMLPGEAAEHLGCGYDKLLQMVRKKELPHYRIGRRVFFIKETLDLWIENQEKQSIQTENGLRMVR